MHLIRKRLTYANVISTLALFLVLGGATAFAAGQLGKNTVGTKQLKKNAVTQAKIKKEAVVGAKIKSGAITGVKVTNDSLTGTQINEGTLGTVPSATNASIASSLTAPEGIHIVGTSGNPSFENGTHNLADGIPGITLPLVGFWKDKEGMVHLQGYVKFPKGLTLPSIFTLPPGFRPQAGAITIWEPGGSQFASIIGGTGASLEGFDLSGKVVAGGGESEQTILEGISYRAGS